MSTTNRNTPQNPDQSTGLAGQTRLFTPPPPDFDEMCPPGPAEQLALDMPGAEAVARQMTTYDYDC